MIFYIVPFYCIFSTLIAQNEEWINPGNKPVVYLFAPGIFASERQIVKYSGRYHASTGQEVTCANNFIVINKPYYSINFPEIVLKNEKPLKSHYSLFGLRSLLNYCMSLMWNYRQSSHDRIDRIGIEHSEIPNSIKYYDIAMEYINFGQERDVQQLSNDYDAVISHYPDHDIVLFGVSRGAATALTFLGTEYLTKQNKRIKAVICESSFDSFDNLIASKLQNILFRLPGLTWALYTTLSLLFPDYKPNGMSPLKIAENIPDDIPILFIASKSDTLVPLSCTENLYQRLIVQNHTIHKIILEKAPHPRYPNNNEKDTFTYLAAVHTFYKKYNVPYNVHYARNGESFLDQS